MLPAFSLARTIRFAAGIALCWLLTMQARAQTVNVIEYYDASQDHYFISSLQPDINALDSGKFPGWVRTGVTFGAYSQANPGSSPVCRFYIPPVDGDSHFYSASPAECAAVQAKYPAFVLESSNVMYIDLPDPTTGACPAGDISVYRVWDNRADTNHRYTTSLAIRAQMVAKGWVAEGYGPNLVIMCAPPGPAIGRYRVATRGLVVYIERRGYSAGYGTGQVMYQFDTIDGVTGTTVGAEAALQLQVMKSTGVNTITIFLNSSDLGDGTFTFPTCSMPPVAGLQWPQPTADELSGLGKFFDLAASNGIKIQLMLNNTHMDDIPNSQTWLHAILGVVGNHPALDLVAFNGDLHLIDTRDDGVINACGGQSEPPLWRGITEPQAQYVQWAIGYGLSLGIPSRKLSAEAVVGDISKDSQPLIREATDGHWWSPIVVLKQIFDALKIPDGQRTYLLSFYEHRKCIFGTPSCIDEDPPTYADETLQNTFSTIGTGNGARVVAAEMGGIPPITSTWPSQSSLESLISVMEKYGVDGGSYWLWTEYNNVTETDPTHAGEPVKLRGTAFNYNPVQKEVLDMGGFHLSAIANGSFENGGATPSNWTIATSGGGTGSRYFLAGEPGQPTVPTRGSYSLRLVSGSAATDIVSATNDPIAVSPNTTYTTTANLRFVWSGDPNPAAAPSTRPQVFVKTSYYDAAGQPSPLRANDVFSYFQEDSTAGFATFPLSYTTPADAAFVRLQFGIARNGLPTTITFDADNVR